MEQRLDLYRILQGVHSHSIPTATNNPALDPSHIQFEVSCYYRARTDCPSVVCLRAKIVDARHRVMGEWQTPVLDAPADSWEQARVLVQGGIDWSQARYLSVVVVGKDSRFWQGLYGSKVAGIAVRALGTPEQCAHWMGRTNTASGLLRNMPRPAEDTRPLQRGAAAATGVLPERLDKDESSIKRLFLMVVVGFMAWYVMQA